MESINPLLGGIKMKVALYARVSTEKQIDNYSIPLQLERMQAFCKSKGWNEMSEYIDGGYSGSNLNRPAIEQLQKDICHKKINAVIVYRLDRLSRSQHDTLYLIEKIFLPNNVQFISLSETIDTSTLSGRAMIGVMSVFAQLEREVIIERLRDGQHKMIQEKGLWVGGGLDNPYGYIQVTPGHLKVVEEERQHILRLYEEFIKLKSPTAARKKLEEEGFKKLNHNRIIRILQNRLYLGEVSFKKEWFKGSHEPIISTELFNQAQQIFDENRVASFGKPKKKLFTGKIICSCCGENYVIQYASKTTSSGRIVNYQNYVCRRRKLPARYESKCFNRRIKCSDFQHEIFNRIMNLEMSGEIKIPKPLNFTKQLNQIDRKINKLLDLYMEERLSKDLLNTKLNDLNKQKKEVLMKQQEITEVSEVQKAIKNGIPNLFECDTETQTEIINLFIKKIIVTNESLKIIWNN